MMCQAIVASLDLQSNPAADLDNLGPNCSWKRENAHPETFNTLENRYNQFRTPHIRENGRYQRIDIGGNLFQKLIELPHSNAFGREGNAKVSGWHDTQRQVCP